MDEDISPLEALRQLLDDIDNPGDPTTLVVWETASERPAWSEQRFKGVITPFHYLQAHMLAGLKIAQLHTLGYTWQILELYRFLCLKSRASCCNGSAALHHLAGVSRPFGIPLYAALGKWTPPRSNASTQVPPENYCADGACIHKQVAAALLMSLSPFVCHYPCGCRPEQTARKHCICGHFPALLQSLLTKDW